MEKKTIKICSSHQKYKTPLIWTFAFPGAEYWCPYCGRNEGMLGAGTTELNTPELEERLKKFKEHSKNYLNAIGTRSCSSLMWKGERINPNDLPEEEKQRREAFIRDYKYQTEIESVGVCFKNEPTHVQ